MENEQVSEQEETIRLLDFIFVLFKWKRLVLFGILTLVVITAVLCLVVTPLFQGVTQIMPPNVSSSSGLSQAVSQLRSAAGMLLGSSGSGYSSDLFAGLLRCEAVLDRIIDRFDLMTLYGMSFRSEARSMLSDRMLYTEIDTKSGILLLNVSDPSAQRSADMTNAFVEELRNLISRLDVTDASKKRRFFEGELKTSHDALTKAEDLLQRFSQDTGAIKIDDQASAVLQGITNLVATVAAKEVALSVMRSYATSMNPDLKRAEEELASLREQLRQLSENQTNSLPDAILPTRNIPTLATEYIRLMRDFKYQETLYDLLVKQYEAARLDAAKEEQVVQQIFTAAVPEKPGKPNLLLFLVVAFALGLFGFTGAAFVIEFCERSAEKPENKQRLDELQRQFVFKRG
jgi:tyrosine-protein kinase Etk/Wzc